ncbi:MAG: RNA methyltransferase [Saprospiraceae bacterium]|nr:RNA methyltransferase [Saprospiraceae bacterium]
MLSLNQIKLINSLSVKKYRREHGLFVVEGEKMVEELLRQSRLQVSMVFGIKGWLDNHQHVLQQLPGKWQEVTESELKKISTLTTPNQVLATVELPASAPEYSLAADALCFYLDGLQDPGNLGAILRIADWFGMPAVFCSPDCVDVYNPKVVQASMGAICRVQSWEVNLSDLMENQTGLTISGAVLNGSNVFEAELPSKGLLVIGNEGKGISPNIERLLTQRLTIPKHPDGGAESLNAAVAAGILAAFCFGSR